MLYAVAAAERLCLCSLLATTCTKFGAIQLHAQVVAKRAHAHKMLRETL